MKHEYETCTVHIASFYNSKERTHTDSHSHIDSDVCLFMYVQQLPIISLIFYFYFFTKWRFSVFALPHHNNILPDPSPIKCSYTIRPSRPQYCSLNQQSGFYNMSLAATGSHIGEILHCNYMKYSNCN